MNVDLLFLLGMGLFYLLRRISRQNQERARQQELLESGEEPSDGGEAPSPAGGSIMAAISAMIEEEAERQWRNDLGLPHEPAPSTAVKQAARPDTSDFHSQESSPFDSEWKTESRQDWSDQTTDFDFHAAAESKPTRRKSSKESPAVDAFADDGARHAPGLAELDRRRPSHRIRRMYQSGNSLKEAIILSEIIGPPVSRRTRSARRPLS